ncbi:hypothetical protein T03_5233 [Trichinella britovi]|uniref:Uncharacterized protein n=1 Tax=Trichinella britovi TaxID=45882 RepID=A0A0V1BTE3_TRIBR|nr:hypothetical protein T03_5233 [Trichinella britovi]
MKNIPQATATNCGEIKHNEAYVKFALWCQDAGNEAVGFDSVNIDFAKLDGEQFCRLHSGHLRRSVPNGSNLHDARNCVSAIRRCKEEGSFAESCRNVVEF